MESKATKKETAFEKQSKRTAQDQESCSKREDDWKEKRSRREEAHKQHGDFDSPNAAVSSNEQASVAKGSFSHSAITHRTENKNPTDGDESQLNTAVTDAAHIASLLEEDIQLESANAFFPNKIMALLDSGKESEAMWWQPGGDSFCIVKANFDNILQAHFQGTKFESFTRKLNRWYVLLFSFRCNTISNCASTHCYHRGFRRAVSQKVTP
jgi:HSF-type DNA-binding